MTMDGLDTLSRDCLQFNLSFESFKATGAGGLAAPEGSDDPLNTPVSTTAELITFFATDAVIPDPVPISGRSDRTGGYLPPPLAQPLTVPLRAQPRPPCRTRGTPTAGSRTGAPSQPPGPDQRTPGPSSSSPSCSPSLPSRAPSRRRTRIPSPLPSTPGSRTATSLRRPSPRSPTGRRPPSPSTTKPPARATRSSARRTRTARCR